VAFDEGIIRILTLDAVVKFKVSYI